MLPALVIPPDSTVYSLSNSVPGLRNLRASAYAVNRRLEDRVRELCALAVVARRDDERDLILRNSGPRCVSIASGSRKRRS
jgi:hypothetical protein